jgi:hypothetical protein
MKTNQFKQDEHLREDTKAFSVLVSKNGGVEPYFINKDLYEQFVQEHGQDIVSFEFMNTWVKTKSI